MRKKKQRKERRQRGKMMKQREYGRHDNKEDNIKKKRK